MADGEKKKVWSEKKYEAALTTLLAGDMPKDFLKKLDAKRVEYEVFYDKPDAMAVAEYPTEPGPPESYMAQDVGVRDLAGALGLPAGLGGELADMSMKAEVMPDTSQSEALMSGIARGATGEFADEITASIATGFGTLPYIPRAEGRALKAEGAMPEISTEGLDPSSPEFAMLDALRKPRSQRLGYEEDDVASREVALTELRDKAALLQSDWPGTSLAGQVVGGTLLTMAGGEAALLLKARQAGVPLEVARQAQMAQQARLAAGAAMPRVMSGTMQSGKIGAGLGGLNAAGRSERIMSDTGIVADIGEGMVTEGVMGLATGFGMDALMELPRAAGRRMSRGLESGSTELGREYRNLREGGGGPSATGKMKPGRRVKQYLDAADASPTGSSAEHLASQELVSKVRKRVEQLKKTVIDDTKKMKEAYYLSNPVENIDISEALPVVESLARSVDKNLGAGSKEANELKTIYNKMFEEVDDVAAIGTATERSMVTGFGPPGALELSPSGSAKHLRQRGTTGDVTVKPKKTKRLRKMSIEDLDKSIRSWGDKLKSELYKPSKRDLELVDQAFREIRSTSHQGHHESLQAAAATLKKNEDMYLKLGLPPKLKYQEVEGTEFSPSRVQMRQAAGTVKGKGMEDTTTMVYNFLAKDDEMLRDMIDVVAAVRAYRRLNAKTPSPGGRSVISPAKLDPSFYLSVNPFDRAKIATASMQGIGPGAAKTAGVTSGQVDPAVLIDWFLGSEGSEKSPSVETIVGE